MKEKKASLLDQLPPDFFKQFKNGEDFQGFIDALFKKGVESLLEGELDGHLVKIARPFALIASCKLPSGQVFLYS